MNDETTEDANWPDGIEQGDDAVQRRVGSSSSEVGSALLEFLGVPTINCRSAVITLKVGCPVIVEAEYLGSMEYNADTSAIKTKIHRFTLVEDVEGGE